MMRADSWRMAAGFGISEKETSVVCQVGVSRQGCSLAFMSKTPVVAGIPQGREQLPRTTAGPRQPPSSPMSDLLSALAGCKLIRLGNINSKASNANQVISFP
jgi:hypothetical protein